MTDITTTTTVKQVRFKIDEKIPIYYLDSDIGFSPLLIRTKEFLQAGMYWGELYSDNIVNIKDGFILVDDVQILSIENKTIDLPIFD